jgi:hypothetical protein
MVCIGDFWAASEGLDDWIVRIGRMISAIRQQKPVERFGGKVGGTELPPSADRSPAGRALDRDREPVPAGPLEPSSPSGQCNIEEPAAAPDPWSGKIVIAAES